METLRRPTVHLHLHFYVCAGAQYICLTYVCRIPFIARTNPFYPTLSLQPFHLRWQNIALPFAAPVASQLLTFIVA